MNTGIPINKYKIVSSDQVSTVEQMDKMYHVCDNELYVKKGFRRFFLGLQSVFIEVCILQVQIFSFSSGGAKVEDFVESMRQYSAIIFVEKDKIFVSTSNAELDISSYQADFEKWL